MHSQDYVLVNTILAWFYSINDWDWLHSKVVGGSGDDARFHILKFKTKLTYCKGLGRKGKRGCVAIIECANLGAAVVACYKACFVGSSNPEAR